VRWMITGAGGQLGLCLERRLGDAPGHALAGALGHGDLDVADPEAAARALDRLRPDVVANAAAFTWVDRCESEPEQARRGNADGPAVLARACASRGVRLAHVSTDYVFDGTARRPYTEADPPSPRTVYGRSKLEGEQRVREALPDALVVRTAWLYGPGRNFVATILRVATGRQRAGDPTPLRVVDDQFGSPTWAADLADGLVRLVEGGHSGLYHLANRGVATWWDVAREALDHAGLRDLEIERVGTDEFPRPAPRPAYSALDTSKAERDGVRLRPWREALAAHLASEQSPLAAEGGGS